MRTIRSRKEREREREKERTTNALLLAYARKRAAQAPMLKTLAEGTTTNPVWECLATLIDSAYDGERPSRGLLRREGSIVKRVLRHRDAEELALVIRYVPRCCVAFRDSAPPKMRYVEAVYERVLHEALKREPPSAGLRAFVGDVLARWGAR